ncbi:signal recognition particle 14 kDa protein-like isoform X2 [Convolutriloba macropyga]|uniref:signal recognition particle 14 kDa protein-like isoform X2 n=1 Tax=Convolutriloba macropyga TaxID=536237 RepID=UPI003F5215F5
MVLLENDVFLNELTLLFDSCREKGSVNICMKKYDGHTKPKPSNNKKYSQQSAPEPVIQSCLIRANSAHKKISTVVHSKDVNKFHLQFGTILKANMDGLKKAPRPAKAKAN